jgi:RNA polymerase sigma-70 factor (ECF subfamily)
MRMRDPLDRIAWTEFVEIYGPLIYSYGRRRGLQDADASDLVQDVLRSVAAAAGRFVYDPARGSFRGWLLTITRNELNDHLRRASGRATGEGGTTHLAVLAEQPAEDDDDRWERDHREQLFAWAAERIRGTFQAATWDAFWRTTVEHQAPKVVAEGLGMTVGAVYIARSRVLARLREVIAAVEAEEVETQGTVSPARSAEGGAE